MKMLKGCFYLDFKNLNVLLETFTKNEIHFPLGLDLHVCYLFKHILPSWTITLNFLIFGLAQDGPMGDKIHMSTQVMGPYGYAVFRYVVTGHLAPKGDVYSFGVVVLELITGRRSMDKNQPAGKHDLVEWGLAPSVTETRTAQPDGSQAWWEHLHERQRCLQSDPAGSGECLGQDPKARFLMC